MVEEEEDIKAEEMVVAAEVCIQCFNLFLRIIIVTFKCLFLSLHIFYMTGGFDGGRGGGGGGYQGRGDGGGGRGNKYL